MCICDGLRRQICIPIMLGLREHVHMREGGFRPKMDILDEVAHSHTAIDALSLAPIAHSHTQPYTAIESLFVRDIWFLPF